MKRIYRTMKGWTELSPQVEEFYKSLLSGELVEKGRRENASRTREEGRSATPQGETQDDAAGNGTAQQREAVIADPAIPLEDKARAVMDAAGAAMMQAVEEDRAEARRQYQEVYDRYHYRSGNPLAGWLKAPNGKDTNLTEQQWVMVRTQNFKEWFGDWENKPEEASKVIDANGEPLAVFKDVSL